MSDAERSEIDRISDWYLTSVARSDPYVAVRLGIAGPLATDYSVEGVEERLDLARTTLREVNAANTESRIERIAARFLAENMAGEIELWEKDPHSPLLRLMDGPIGEVIAMFRGVLGRDEPDWEEVSGRFGAVPRSLKSMQANLEVGVDRGLIATRREAELFAEYCEANGGIHGKGVLDWILQVHELPAAVAPSIVEAAKKAQTALQELGAFVRASYIPFTSDEDGVGAERFSRSLRYYLGEDVDLQQAYLDNWAHYRETLIRMREVAHEMNSGGDISEAIWHLENDPNENVTGDEEMCRWLSERVTETASSLFDVHFPKPNRIEPLKLRVARGEARSALQISEPVPGRPSTIWVRETGEIQIPTWRYRSLMHGVAIPGNWYRWSYNFSSAKHLNKAQSLLHHRSTFFGWGHYTTQIMDELGLYKSFSSKLSYLQRELFQSIRLMADVGYHLGLEIPEDADVCGGERWTEVSGTQFISNAVFVSRQVAANEMRRAISCAGQLSTYRVGSDVLLEARNRLGVKSGARPDLLEFHRNVLDLGPLGVSDLRDEIAQIPVAKPAGCSGGAPGLL